MKHVKMSRRTTGVREMNRTLETEMLRSDLEVLEQQRVDFDTRRRKFAEASNTRDLPKGWNDTNH
jgi:hypothetical protein